MKYSFIIPVYKVEDYLDICVGSIIEQTYKNFEVILVDDGSPDNCPRICDSWAEKDSRIKVLHKKNEGLSSARNVGLQYASGDYVIFIDSDDFWNDKKALERFDVIIQKSPMADVLFYNVYYYFGKEAVQKWPLYKLSDGNVHSVGESIRELNISGTVPMAAWGKVIRKKILVDNNIDFQLGMFGEDIQWFIHLMLNVNKISFCNDYVYAYRQNNNSSITKINKPKHVRDMKTIIDLCCSAIGKADVEENVKNNLFSFVAYNYCILLSQIFDVSGVERRQTWNFVKHYHFLLKYDRHPKVRKVKKLSSIIGLKLTSIVLFLYKKLR